MPPCPIKRLGRNYIHSHVLFCIPAFEKFPSSLDIETKPWEGSVHCPVVVVKQPSVLNRLNWTGAWIKTCLVPILDFNFFIPGAAIPCYNCAHCLDVIFFQACDIVCWKSLLVDQLSVSLLLVLQGSSGYKQHLHFEALCKIQRLLNKKKLFDCIYWWWRFPWGCFEKLFLWK